MKNQANDTNYIHQHSERATTQHLTPRVNVHRGVVVVVEAALKRNIIAITMVHKQSLVFVLYCVVLCCVVLAIAQTSTSSACTERPISNQACVFASLCCVVFASVYVCMLIVNPVIRHSQPNRATTSEKKTLLHNYLRFSTKKVEITTICLDRRKAG